eukprot:Pgem_evm1s6404
MKELERLEMGDVIVYLDSGCSLQVNDKSKKRFLEYLHMVDAGGVNTKFSILNMNQGMRQVEWKWTKMDLFDYMNISNITDSNIIKTSQYFAGVNVIRKSTLSYYMVKQWYQIGKAQGYRFINDSESKLPNPTGFKEHRHDQSIWSLVRKKNMKNDCCVEVSYEASPHRKSMPFLAT